MLINTTSLHTPIGKIKLAKSDQGLCYLALPGLADRLPSFLNKNFPGAEIKANRDVFSDEINQLEQYFAGQRRQFELELDLRVSPFYKSALELVAKVPYGEVTNYGAIARRLGRPGSVRAVGGANAHNPIPIIIPCHRVLNSKGELNGYAGGLPMKKQLLELEIASYNK